MKCKESANFVLPYHPEIDGLRGVAIVLVLLFHAQIEFFKSGFIGVDIFFVISGYLIVSWLVTTPLSLREFISRRLWRLQPLILFVILLNTILCLLYLLPEDLLDYFRSLRHWSLFKSNQFFMNEAQNYFTSASSAPPLLHTWSLAVEWQFYLLISCLIYGFKKHLNAFLFIFFSMVFLGIHLISSNLHLSEPSYYQLHVRLFEFFLGAALVYTPNCQLAWPRWIKESLATLASMLMIAPASFHLPTTFYPNLWASFPCLSTLILIYLTQDSTRLTATQWLGNLGLISIGKISYALYLWQGIIFSWFLYEKNLTSLENKSLALFIILGLSVLSSQWIERPCHKRYVTWPLIKSISVLVLAPMIIIHGSEMLIKKFDGFPERFGNQYAHVYHELLRQSQHFALRKQCIPAQDWMTRKSFPLNPQCELGDLRAPSRALLIGDSYANHAWGFVDYLGKHGALHMVSQAIPACLMLPGIKNRISLNHEPARPYDLCNQSRDDYFHHIEQHHYQYVLIAQNWLGYLKNYTASSKKHNFLLQFQRGLEQAISRIEQSGAQAILIFSLSEPEHIEEVLKCTKEWIKNNTSPQAMCLKKINISREEKQLNHIIRSVKASHPKLQLIQLNQEQCDPTTKICTFMIDGGPMFADTAGHITDFAAVSLAKSYLKHHPNPFKPIKI